MISMLPDTNVWLALVYNLHPHHQSAAGWFAETEDPLYFCRVSQMGLLRLLTNRAVVGNGALTQRQAWQAYKTLSADPRVEFADEPATLEMVFHRLSSRDEISPKRWTDDYLAAFAEAASLTLITFDRNLAARASSATLLKP